MSALKKLTGSHPTGFGKGEAGDFSGNGGLRPYDQEITAEAVRRLQEEADKDLAGEEWVLVDGYEVTK